MKETSLSMLDRALVEIWQDVLGVPVGKDDNFFVLGGNSVQAAMIMNRLQDRMRTVFHPAVIFDAPTITLLGKYFQKNFPHLYGAAEAPVSTGFRDLLTAEDIEQGRKHFRDREGAADLRIDESSKKNGPAIFILSPPRSGSTLLRVILGGHPQLFSPPELYLLSFNTMKERRDKLSGRFAFFREGLLRAIMQLRGVDKEDAERIIAAEEEQNTSTHTFFRAMQEWADGKLVIDKTPGYALQPNALRRAEAEFDGAMFIHLVRHPMATIASFEDVRVDLVTGDERDPLPESARKRGELWWLISHEHILSFLQTVPAERQIRVRYEDLVKNPELVVRSLCDKLRIEYHPAMLRPYEDEKDRMTDGVSDVSRMLGDQKFHFYDRIEASRGDDWRSNAQGDFLCDRSWAVADALGYEREVSTDEEREQWEI